MDDRRTLLRRAGLGLLVAGGVGQGRGAPAAAQHGGPPDDPMRLLEDGNSRFVNDAMVHPNQSSARRAQIATGDRQPFAIVFSCIDSRTPPEIVFDRGLGDMFVVRTVAQDYDTLVEGSVEYGPVTDATPLMVVLGHQRCNTVTIAVEALESGTTPPPNLDKVVQAVRPAYLLAKATLPKDRAALIDAAIGFQTRLAVRDLRNDPVLGPRFRQGRLQINGAYYSLDTGVVSWPNY